MFASLRFASFIRSQIMRPMPSINHTRDCIEIRSLLWHNCVQRTTATSTPRTHIAEEEKPKPNQAHTDNSQRARPNTHSRSILTKQIELRRTHETCLKPLVRLRMGFEYGSVDPNSIKYYCVLSSTGRSNCRTFNAHT